MRKPCFVLLLCLLFGFGVSQIIPAEDVPETAYDESETLPYVSTSMVSIPVRKVILSVPGGRAVVAVFHLASLRGLGSQHQASSPHYICDSLIILDRSLRC